MTTVSITQLKGNPSAALLAAQDFPVAVKNRDKTTGYILGKAFFEKLMSYLEDLEDKKVISKIDFSKGKDFEEFASELGI